MMSTHWRGRHQPTERELCLFDLLARQAADLLERSLAADAMQAAQARTSEILESISDTFYAVDDQWRLTYLNARAVGLQDLGRQRALAIAVLDLP